MADSLKIKGIPKITVKDKVHTIVATFEYETDAEEPKIVVSGPGGYSKKHTVNGGDGETTTTDAITKSSPGTAEVSYTLGAAAPHRIYLQDP